MKTTKRAGPEVRPKSTGPRWRKYTLVGKTKRVPAELGAFFDFPHLQNGGEWSAKDDKPKRKLEFYLGWLRSLGMSEVDAKIMVSDLYWDCWSELMASGRRIEEFSALWESTANSWNREVVGRAARRDEGAR
jgi:hypothetical protein